MFSRIIRLLSSFLGSPVISTYPVKALTGVIMSIIIPYLLYAFLGGFGLAVAIFGLGWLIWYLAAKKRN